jgi:hypothetical protein
MCLFLVASLSSAVLAKDTRDTGNRNYSGVDMAVNGDGVVLTASGSLGNFKAAGTDTFCLYGGPGSVLGKFQAALPPGDTFTSSSQSWYHKDVTDQPTLWQLGTFNSPTGTQCMWAGQTAAQQPGWATAPGYGNSWNALLTFTSTVSNPALGQTVGLTFVFNHDSEGGYDYFDVEYDSAGVTTRVYHRDGNNKNTANVFVPVNYPTGAAAPIVHEANSYNGLGGNEIIIRMAGRSDGAWSDEDGLNPSSGLAQVDNIQVTTLDGASPVEDFDVGPFQWNPEKSPFAGDFSDTFTGMTDIDPCRDNNTGVIGFIDDGDGPYNPTYFGTGTGGTTSDNWTGVYGIPNGWVVNYNGGISAGSLDLDNEWWSPQIDWDVDTGVTDASDDAEVAGALIRMSIWRHLPLLNGMFYQWSVRGHDTQSGNWSAWDNRNFVYYGNDGDWINIQPVVSDLLPPYKDLVQMQFAVRDLASLFAFAGTDGTPSPTGDNMAFLKFRLGGPVFATRTIDLFQDSFAQSGATDVSDSLLGPNPLLLRDQHDVRIDMARDANTGVVNNVPGDSIIFDVTSVIPGVAITDSINQITMHYSLNMNPIFESAIRGNAPVTGAATGMYGWDQHEGTVKASQTFTSAGAAIADRYFFDLPDVDFMYPGDVLEYYIRAVDDALNTTTIPGNLAGFDDTTANYNRTYTVRALPTYTSTSGDHPDILFWNDFGRRGGEAEAIAAFNQNGLYEGVHFDSYTTQGPSSLVSNGLGSAGAHGANSDQLRGYSCIITEHGDLSAGLISNGSNAGSDDKGDDAGTLTGWWSNPTENRAIAHFGDNLASMLNTAGSANTYLSGVINATWVAKSIRPTIGNQIAPLVKPSGAVATFGTDFIAYGGCLLINQFDSVTPGGGAVVSHNFMDASGTVALGNAGIYNVTTNTDTGAVHQSLFFPYGLLYVYHPTSKIAAGASARAALLEEILTLFGGAHLPNPGPAVGNPNARSLAVEQPYPNPFNPKTTIRFTLGVSGKGSVKIYNIRGALVRTLKVGDFEAGLNVLEWNGRDDRGSSVASGVYAIEIIGNGERHTMKAVMIK